jgi:hypothetical protein
MKINRRDRYHKGSQFWQETTHHRHRHHKIVEFPKVIDHPGQEKQPHRRSVRGDSRRRKLSSLQHAKLELFRVKP